MKNPGADDLLKRRCAAAAQCRPCFSYMDREPCFAKMSQSERVKFLSDDTNYEDFMKGLGEWEAKRREGEARPRGTSNGGVSRDRAEAEQSSSIMTKQVLGFLWPIQLLKEHGKDVPKRLQHITHQGKKVKGVILKEYAVGAIEITSQSSKTARRLHVMAEDNSDESGEADDVFAGMEKSLQMSTSTGESGEILLKQAKIDSDDEMASILWGDAAFGGHLCQYPAVSSIRCRLSCSALKTLQNWCLGC